MNNFSFWVVPFSVFVSAVCFAGMVAAQDLEFPPQVKQYLEQRKALVEALAKNPSVVDHVRASNKKNRSLTQDEILELDGKWRKVKGTDKFIASFMTGDCAVILKTFQELHGGFPEVFVTDLKGLNVCQTNKTSDYFQADEAWWVDAYNDGRGKSYYGKVEYDESAKTYAISIYAPVMDAGTGKAIGVIKAVGDVTAILKKFQN